MHQVPGPRRAALAAILVLALGLLAVPASQAGGARAGQLRDVAGGHVAPDGLGAQADEPGEEEGENEAEEVLARFEQDATISNAPLPLGRSVPAAALQAALGRAGSLAQTDGRWQALTDIPYLDDPIPGYPSQGFSNRGVAWGFVSGRMTGLTASGGTVYAGGADGGVWRTRDRGGHWTEISDGLPRIAVGDLATDPRDGSVWVGLGEANTNFDAQNAFGVYRLASGATTWRRVGGRELMTRNVFHIRFLGHSVFAATAQGLYRRPAGDTTSRWQLVLKPDPNPSNSPYRTSMVTDVVALPGTNGRGILANLGWRGGTLPTDTTFNGFYVSHRFGAPGSFARITPRGAIDPTTIGRVTFSAATQGRRIYAVVESSATTALQGVYVSRNGDPVGPWERIAGVGKLIDSNSAMRSPATGFFPGVQAWYNQYVQVDPDDPMHVYLGLEEVFETTNGGRTWFAIGAYWNATRPGCQERPYACPFTTHPDQHSITFAGGEVYAGGDGGVWRRSMDAHRKPGWRNLNRTLHTLQYYSASIGRIPGGDAIYGGLQDNGGSLLRTTAPARQINQFTGDGGDSFADPRNGARVLNEYVFLDITLSTDFGKHDVEISPSCLTAANPPDPCDENPRFIAPFEADVSNPTHWVAGGQYVWVSSKGWKTRCAGDRCDWKIAEDVGEPGPEESTTALAMNGDTIYAGWCAAACNRDQGGPFERGLSTNFGGRWHEVSLAGVGNRYITSLEVDRQDPAHVFLTLGSYNRRWIPGAGVGHVYESSDGGEHFRDISGNLPDAPFHDLVIWGDHLVAAGDVGVFVADRGNPTSWSRLGAGLPRARVWDLEVAPGGRYLVAATHGRGLWRIRSAS